MTDRLFVRITTRGVSPLLREQETQGAGAQSTQVEASQVQSSQVQSSQKSPQIQWALYRDDQLLSGPGECRLDEVIAQLPETIRASAIPSPMLKVIAIVPGEEVCLSEVVLPSTQAKHIAKALPYMLEDNLTEDIDLVHFSLGAKRKNKATSVAIVNRVLLENWIDLFVESGLSPEILVPDTLLTPLDDNVWTVLFDGERVLLRTASNRGLAFMANQTATILEATLDYAFKNDAFKDDDVANVTNVTNVTNDAMTIRFLYSEENENARLSVNVIENELAALQSSQDKEYPVLVERNNIMTTPLEVLCVQLCTASAEKNILNLLQGEYKQEFSHTGINIKWKPVAALFSVWMMLFLGGQLGQTYYYGQKADQLDQESKAHFRELFPRIKKVKNVKKQMSSLIRQAGSADAHVGFVPLLGSTGKFVYDFNNKKEGTVILERITFDDKQGNLRVDMRISNFTDLEMLKDQIEQSGLKVTIDAATKDADKVKARLRIKG